MNSANQSAPAQQTPTTAADALALIARLDRGIEALTAILDQEDALVRAGRLTAVAKLAASKGEAARDFLTGSQVLKDSLPRLRGSIAGVLEGVKTRHAAFHARLQRNLTVLATAQAVSEGIMRGVAAEVSRTTGPQVYGASGRTVMPGRAAYQPMALNRAL